MKSASSLSKKASWSAFMVSALCHGALLLGVGGYVISQTYVPKTPFIGEDFPAEAPMAEPDVLMEPDSGPPGPPSDLQEVPLSQASPTPVPADPNPFATANVLAAVSGPSFFGAVAFSGAPLGTGTALGGGAGGSGRGTETVLGKMTTPFGSLKQSAGTLRGTLFDLKRNKDGSPSGMDRGLYLKEIEAFVDKDWRVEEVLGKYYQLAQPIYASQFFIPLQRAEAAPAAFGAEKEVKPAMWAILYTGQFKSPQGGSIRLVGYADDVLLVRVNGRTVLDGSRGSLGYDRNFEGITNVSKNDAPTGHLAGNGRLSYGAWMHLAAGQTHSIEVLLGECPGGQFCAFLLIEDKAGDYAKESGSGRPILPIFRMADVRMNFEAAIQAKTAPAYQEDGPVFGN